MRAAITTADNFARNSLCEGKKPKTIAGVAIYMVLNKLKDNLKSDSELLQEISEFVGIGAQTIKECYSQVYHYRDKLLSEELLPKRKL